LNLLRGNRPSYSLDWNGPVDRPYDVFSNDDTQRPIMALFERMVQRHPDTIALQGSGPPMTYRALWMRAHRVGQELSIKTSPGQLVGIYLSASAEFAVAILACFAAGRPFVALDRNYPKDWVEHVVEDAAPALIIVTSAEQHAAATELSGHNLLDLSLLPDGGPSAIPALTPLGPDEPACVLYTSGSTGRPKGIVNSQGNLLQRVAQSINAAHFGPDDRFLTLASLCTIVGVRDLVTALLCGARVRLADAQRLSVRELADITRNEGITVLFAFPALLRALVDKAQDSAGQALRLIRAGGDTMLWSDFDLLRGWLSPGGLIQLIYAATEAPIMQWFVADQTRDSDRIPIGFPLPGNALTIVDNTGEVVPAGEIGELVIRSRYVALGYWRDGRCSLDTIERDPVDPSLRILRTGDLVRERANGLLDRIGRNDRQLKIRGLRVEPEGVEATLRLHPRVLDCAVIARSASDGIFSLVAYATARGAGAPDLVDELAAWMRERAPAHMRPQRIHLIASIPRLPSSKLHVGALTALDKQLQADERQAARSDPHLVSSPRRSDVEAQVAQIWQRNLGRAANGPDADFFDYGGDSMKALRFIDELERALSVELSITLINERPTFGALCDGLLATRVLAYDPLVSIKAGEGKPPLYIIHGIGGTIMELFALGRRMTYAGAVYGIQARGLDGRCEPHATIDAMATAYLEAIRACQPEGPYQLCGYSFGGLVALEMAKQLHAAGDEVSLLAMIDTLPNVRRWPFDVWLLYVLRRLFRRAHGLTTVPMRQWVRYIVTHVSRAHRLVTWRLRASEHASPILPADSPGIPAHVGAVMRSAVGASARYRPAKYPGKVTLLRPAVPDPDFAHPENYWRRYAQELRILRIPGAHGSILSEPNVTAAAQLLTACMPP
jgi:amino acid adenylation domain-containing protein